MRQMPKILIVEDELRMCESLEYLLKSQNYKVKTANCGQDALVLIAEDSFDLAVLDNFDGMSAYYNALEKENGNYFVAFIDTNGLNKIYDLDIDIFQKKANSLIKNKKKFIFIGKHKHRFAV